MTSKQTSDSQKLHSESLGGAVCWLHDDRVVGRIPTVPVEGGRLSKPN